MRSFPIFTLQSPPNQINQNQMANYSCWRFPIVLVSYMKRMVIVIERFSSDCNNCLNDCQHKILFKRPAVCCLKTEKNPIIRAESMKSIFVLIKNIRDIARLTRNLTYVLCDPGGVMVDHDPATQLRAHTAQCAPWRN